MRVPAVFVGIIYSIGLCFGEKSYQLLIGRQIMPLVIARKGLFGWEVFIYHPWTSAPLAKSASS